MASPVAHTLVALAVAGAVAPRAQRANWRWYALAAFAGNAADLDFLAGMVVGQINRFHHGPSHSLGAALLFGTVVGLVGAGRGHGRVRTGMLAGWCYASHLLIDSVSGSPWGQSSQPLFWPASARQFDIFWRIFGGIEHGSAGADLSTFAQCVCTQRNALEVGIELAVTLPLAVLVAEWLRTIDTSPATATLPAAAEETAPWAAEPELP